MLRAPFQALGDGTAEGQGYNNENGQNGDPLPHLRCLRVVRCSLRQLRGIVALSVVNICKRFDPLPHRGQHGAADAIGGAGEERSADAQ